MIPSTESSLYTFPGHLSLGFSFFHDDMNTNI